MVHAQCYGFPRRRRDVDVIGDSDVGLSVHHHRHFTVRGTAVCRQRHHPLSHFDVLHTNPSAVLAAHRSVLREASAEFGEKQSAPLLVS